MLHSTATRPPQPIQPNSPCPDTLAFAMCTVMCHSPVAMLRSLAVAMPIKIPMTTWCVFLQTLWHYSHLISWISTAAQLTLTLTPFSTSCWLSQMIHSCGPALRPCFQHHQLKPGLSGDPRLLCWFWLG